MTEQDYQPRLKVEKLRKSGKTTKHIYLALLILTAVVFIVGIFHRIIGDVVIAVPVIAILCAILIYDKEFIHVPPVLIFVVVVALYFSLASHLIDGENVILNDISFILSGVVLGVIGLIIAYVALGKMPGFAKEKPSLIATESLSFGIAAGAVWTAFSYFAWINFDRTEMTMTLDSAILQISWISVGALISALSYYLDVRMGLFMNPIVDFLDENSDTIGIEKENQETLDKLILEGESYDLEFKSTLRTNLKTGEQDKRMEKAVLKTIVAFLNSDGGTLLVGVEDDGNILGVDLEGFDNRDKMNLHITNLLSSQIGDEFIPFIKFRQIDCGKKESGADKVVVMFTCKPTASPVFLKEGKDTETYFVRSGPSSVVLTGVDLLKYAENRRKLKRKIPLVSDIARLGSSKSSAKIVEDAKPEPEKEPEKKDAKKKE